MGKNLTTRRKALLTMFLTSLLYTILCIVALKHFTDKKFEELLVDQQLIKTNHSTLLLIK